METEYMTRTPTSTKFWLTLFNLVIPVLIIAACISSLEATSVSRVYFLLISVGGTVGLVLVGLFLVYQFHPVGDTYRWLKFFLGLIVLALLIVTIIFDTGTTSFGWKGTNFVVYLIVIALTFNTICKILMVHGAGPYRFGFCLTWFKYCDTIFGLIVYGPWLVFSFIGLASIQTRLLYNRAFFRGLRVSELLQQDPNKRDRFRARPANVRGGKPVGARADGGASSDQSGAGVGGGAKGLGVGFTPLALTRENSMDDLRAAGMRPRTGLTTQFGEHTYENRAKNYPAGSAGGGGSADSRVPSGQNSPTGGNRSYNVSRRGSDDFSAGLSPEQRQRLMAGRQSEQQQSGGQHLAPPQVGSGSMVIRTASPSEGLPAGAARAAQDDEKQAGGQPRYTYN